MAKINLNDEFKTVKPMPKEGWHDCKVSGIEIKTSNKGTKYVDLTFVLSDETKPYVGYESRFNNFFFSDAAIGRLVEVLRAANPDFKNNPKFSEFDPEEIQSLNWALKGKQVSAYFEISVSQGKDQNGNPKEFQNLKPIKFKSIPKQDAQDEHNELGQGITQIVIDDSDIPF